MEYPVYCQLTASNTVRDQKTPYTIYEIEVRSSSTIKWVIYRRYSDFFALHQELLKVAVNGQDGTIRLPYLPPKRLTRSLAVDFVEKRKLELQAYLTELLRSRTLLSLPSVLQFLAVPDSVRPMLVKQHDISTSLTLGNEKSPSEELDTSVVPSKRRGGTLSPEERKIREFISQLNTVPNKVHTIRVFQQYYFSQRPRFTSELIIILFEGSSPKELGLIWACGDLNYSIVSSKAALEFICKLLDVEKNKDAQQFLDVVSTFDTVAVKKLNLHRHILNDRTSPAFQLAYIMSQTIPFWTTDKCLLDVTARQEFQRWVQRKIMIAENHGVFVDRKHKILDESPNLTSQYCLSISKAAFETLHAVASSDQGWKLVPGPLDHTSSIIQIVHKQISEGQYIVRLAAVLSADPKAAFDLILNEERRKEWDLKIHSSKIIERIDDNTDIVEESYLGDSTCSKPFDLTMIRCWRKEPDGSYAITKRSVSRGSRVFYASMLSGFLITPIHHGKEENGSSTLLLWLSQLDRESIQLVISDLLGESNSLLKSFTNLNRILETA